MIFKIIWSLLEKMRQNEKKFDKNQKSVINNKNKFKSE